MKIMIVGANSRTHAVAKNIRQYHKDAYLITAPKNENLIPLVDKSYDVEELDVQKYVEIAQRENIELVIITGSSLLMYHGLADELKKLDIKVFGACKEASLAEASKIYFKEFANKYNIPTPPYKIATSEEELINLAQNANKYPILFKGDHSDVSEFTVVINNLEEAKQYAWNIWQNKDTKYTGPKKIIVEEFIDGFEFSLMAFIANGKSYPMPVIRDYKKAFENDQGPNTDGVGCISPVSHVSSDVVLKCKEQILDPFARGVRLEGSDYCGFFYGTMFLHPNGDVSSVDFNVRLGDPEATIAIERLDDDILQIILDLLAGKEVNPKWNNDCVLGVVLSDGNHYPNNFEENVELKGLDKVKNSYVYHINTKLENGKVINTFDRLVIVVGKAKTMKEAKDLVYKDVEIIKNETKSNIFYRKDIGDIEINKK